MGPLLGGLPVSVVPNATVKRRDILVLCFYFLLSLKPDTDPARVPLLDEYLQGFLQQLFSRSAVQGRARDASSAWCCVRFFPPNSHRCLVPSRSPPVTRESLQTNSSSSAGPSSALHRQAHPRMPVCPIESITYRKCGRGQNSML